MAFLPLSVEASVWLVLFSSLFASIAAYLSLIKVLTPPRPPAHVSETTFLTATSPNSPQPLPPITSPPEVSLSVVIPAYNESDRIKPMLDDTLAHLETLPASRTYELIVVDDGSRDSTARTVLQYITSRIPAPRGEVRVIRLVVNRKKGAATRYGVLHSRGERILFVDADGATRFSDVELLWTELDRIQGANERGVVVGSRAHLVKTEAVVKRSFLRNFLMYSFHLLLRMVGVGYVRDTQCGFKLFTRSAARDLFTPLHLPTWTFDVELLLLARYLALPVAEVSVVWSEIPGSKLSVWDSLEMLKDLIFLLFNYTFGIWKTTDVDLVDQRFASGSEAKGT